MMDAAYTTAIAMYERSLWIFAQRAGVERKLPETSLNEIAQKAEKLALGSELSGPISARPVLTSIVGHLHGEERHRYYRPQVMASQRVLPEKACPANLLTDYQNLWQAFQTEFAECISETQSAQVREANWHALFQRYTWAMAAPTHHTETDISLFDYARMSAALAVCLHERAPDQQEVALLIGGDLSGVQDWLYTFGSSGAARTLRGRSFYLQLLTEVIAFYLLDKLRLPMANLLYAGGGNFYILAPVQQEATVMALQKEISSKLLQMHSGALYMALACTPLTEARLKDKALGEAWHDVNKLMNVRKAQRFAELDDEQMAKAIGSPLAGTGLYADSCRVCGRTITPQENTTKKQIVDANGGFQCGLCGSFEKLGNELRDANFLVVNSIEPEEATVVIDWQRGLRQLGFDVRTVPNGPAMREQTAKNGDGFGPQVQSQLARVFYWKEQPDFTIFQENFDKARTVWAFRPLAQCVPLSRKPGDSHIADFEEIAQASEGIERWGVLRMDVDNLGKIFQGGIPASNLSRVVGLSGLLRQFFEGYVPELAKRINEGDLAETAAKQPTAPRLYLMYAGGDDLFVVGAWSYLPILAAQIRQQFAKFACDNPQVTISGGISLALGNKYPLYRAADDAGDAEEQAKDHGKNALAFLGQAVKWDGEFASVQDRVRQLTEWVQPETGKLPRSFLMNLRAIDAEWQTWKKQESAVNHHYAHTNKTLFFGPWQWHLTYSLIRAGERTKESEIKQYMQEYVQTIIKGEIKLLGLTARWTELLTRKESSK